MKTLWVILLLIGAQILVADNVSTQLSPMGAIPLPDVKGRLDHLTVDPGGQRLFVAAETNNSIEVVDLKSNQRVGRIDGLPAPRGIVFLQGMNKLVVACGGDGTLRAYDGETFKELARLQVGTDPNNIDFDLHGRLLYVGYDASVAVVDALTMKSVGTIEVGGHPEGLRVDSSGATLYVNVPSRNRIAVIDAHARTTTGWWPASGNYPMALDESGDHLFVGSRKPASIVGYTLSTGKRAISLSIGADANDIFYDATLRRLYVSCGSGTVDVYEWVNVDSYKRQLSVKTAKGARTSLLVPGMGMLFVAVPATSSATAEIRTYGIKPF